MSRPEQPAQLFANRDFWALFVASVAFFALVALVVRHEISPEWRRLQHGYEELLRARGGEPSVRRFEGGVRQIWLPRLGVVDRCVTCHLNADHTGRDDGLPAPFAPHPPLPIMERHPPSTFGCTPCHGGQGFATRRDDAHGLAPHWQEPLVTLELARPYGLSRGEMMEIRCNGCHRRDLTTPGMDLLDLGKRVLGEQPCGACHVVEGEGGLVGPDLTYEGDKNPEGFDFSHVAGERTVLNWHLRHFEDPQALNPESSMPNPGLSRRETLALAALMMSWRRQMFPPEYIPAAVPKTTAAVPPIRTVPLPPLAPRAPEPARQGWALFRQRGCHTCHSVGHGTVLGPDLRGVMRRRTDAWVRRWLADPATMIRADPELQGWPEQYSGVLMPNQNLTAAEIDLLVAYLKTF